MNKRFLIGFLLLSALLGCGEDTGPGEPVTFHFYRPNHWNKTANVYLEYWGGSLGWSHYPGVAMVSNDSHWFSRDFSAGQVTLMSFNDGIGIDGFGDMWGTLRDSTGWYVPAEIWSNSPPTGAPAATGNFTIHFKKPSAWTGTPHIWFWEESYNFVYGDCGINSTSWPGDPMTDSGDGVWYSVTLTGTKTRLIVNEGFDGGRQTLDLVREGEGWLVMRTAYGWFDIKPEL